MYYILIILCYNKSKIVIKPGINRLDQAVLMTVRSKVQNYTVKLGIIIIFRAFTNEILKILRYRYNQCR